MSGNGAPVLWQYSFSNFNEKARWALDHKGVRHRRHSLLPGGPKAMAFWRKGTLPVLDLEGERIMDSTNIIDALESRFPEPPLYPSDPAERKQALELEEFFDEHAGHDTRRVYFWEQRDDRRGMSEFLAIDQPAGARLFLRAGMPVAWAYIVRSYDFSEEEYQRSRDALVAALDRIESERNGGDYLVGDGFTVADLAAAALLYPLAWPDELQYEYPEIPRSDFGESV